MKRRLAILAAALAPVAGGLAVTVPASAAPAEQVPHCRWAAFNQNSGNGPVLRVQFCGCQEALEPGTGTWQWVVDGGRLVNGAVVFCFRAS